MFAVITTMLPERERFFAGTTAAIFGMVHYVFFKAIGSWAYDLQFDFVKRSKTREQFILEVKGFGRNVLISAGVIFAVAIGLKAIGWSAEVRP